LSPERTQVGVSVASKEHVFRYLSELVSAQIPGTSAEDILAGLLAREAMGSTGIGDGVAIPHCRLSQCTAVCGALIRLQDPVDFDAVDRQPVDLVFVLLAPEHDPEQYLQALAMLAERLNRPAFRQALRAAGDAQALYQAAVGYEME
jgi:PTS system nitrogen regulatory IIA component